MEELRKNIFQKIRDADRDSEDMFDYFVAIDKLERLPVEAFLE